MKKKKLIVIILVVAIILTSSIMASAKDPLIVYFEPDCNQPGCPGVLVADDCSCVLLVRLTDLPCYNNETGCLVNDYINYNAGSCTEDLCSGGTNIECGSHECVWLHSICSSDVCCPF